MSYLPLTPHLSLLTGYANCQTVAINKKLQEQIYVETKSYILKYQKTHATDTIEALRRWKVDLSSCRDWLSIKSVLTY